MASGNMNMLGMVLRFLGGFALIAATYNPEGQSYYHWVKGNLTSPSALMAFVGVILIIGYTVFLRATMRSLGSWGILLAFAFFGTLLWLLIEQNIVPANSKRAISYIIMLILAGIMSIGMSWSHIRARLSGQADVGDLEE